MTDEEKKIEEKVRPWRFWFSIALSLFLIVAFILYLPTRFQYNAITMPPHTHMTSSYEAVNVLSGLDVDLIMPALPIMVGVNTQLSFLVNQKPDNTPVSASKLQYEHTKLMHVIGVRDDLQEFFHIHPYPNVPESSVPRAGATYAENTDGIMTANYTFAKPGRYKIWAEVTKDEVNYSFGERDFIVEGDGDRGNGIAPVFLDDVSIGNDTVTFTHDPIVVENREARLAFTIRDKSGEIVHLEPYLGANMHLNIIKSDWSQSIHTHPSNINMMMLQDIKASSLVQVAKAHEEDMTHGEPLGQADQNGIQFRVALPTAGIYKAFAQFRPAGSTLPPDEALVAGFWFKVENAGTVSAIPAGPAPKASLIIASLVGMMLLGWGVKRFLEVKPK